MSTAKFGRLRRLGINTGEGDVSALCANKSDGRRLQPENSSIGRVRLGEPIAGEGYPVGGAPPCVGSHCISSSTDTRLQTRCC